jgi:hypothetical protein
MLALAWQYSGEGDIMWLDVLGTLFGRLSPDPTLVNFIPPLTAYTPMFSD